MFVVHLFDKFTIMNEVDRESNKTSHNVTDKKEVSLQIRGFLTFSKKSCYYSKHSLIDVNDRISKFIFIYRSPLMTMTYTKFIFQN